MITELRAGMKMLNSQVEALALPKPRSYKPTDPYADFKGSIILLILGSDLLDANMQAIQLFQVLSHFVLPTLLLFSSILHKGRNQRCIHTSMPLLLHRNTN
jgi:hypothetical protein